MLKKQLSDKANKENATYPLSYGQKALFFLHLNSPESPAYNVAFAVRILSRLDVDALKKSFQKLVNRHTLLRTNYKIIDGKPVQEVHGYKEAYFEVIDVSGLSEDSLKKTVKETNEIPFDLEKGDVFKIYLFRISDENFVLLMSMHHISNDGWSIGILFEELKNLYEAESEGKQFSFTTLTHKYSDYIKFQEEFIKSNKGKEQWEYWKNELNGELPVLNLPIEKSRPAIQTFNGAVEYFNLDKDLVEQLKNLSKREGATLFVTLMTAYQVFLHRYTGQDDIVVGSPTAGRNQIEFDKIIGYFINPVAVRGRFSGDPTFKDFLAHIRKKVLGAISSQDFPFALIVEKLLQKRDPSRSPVYQTFFGFQKVQQNEEIQEMIVPGNKGERVNWGKLSLESFEITQQEGQFDLAVEFVEGKNLFSGAFKYNTDLFENATIKKMIEHFKILLRNIVANPDKKISEFQLLSDAERNVIINKWNDTDFNFTKFDCIHKLIEEQANKSPDAIAVVYEDKTITFDVLNKQSNQLAHYLSNLGVKPETLVGLCVERSIEMVIGILGILKSGGAYIPIDPFYPQKRVEFMISDSGAKVLITQQSLVESLPKNISNIVLIDEDWENILKESNDNFESKVELKNIAYVIYTSGSTGIPKGVMITHESLANHMIWLQTVFGFNSSDNVLQKTPFSFDASVWEFYLPLLTGGRLVMAKPDGHMDTAYLIDTIQKNNVTILQLVPTLLRMLLNENGIENCKSLKSVFCGGEALTYELQKKLFEKLNVNFYNLYGPTEATIDATYFKCEINSKSKIIPIGKPIYNTQAYILDKYLNPIPTGVAGELYLGGIDVARGYLNNPELTKEKFIDDIFRNNENKLYKSGDLAKYRADGNIEFLGRIDHQVKFHGFRIELGEIESKILKHSEIKESAVIVREDKPGNQRLIAYIVSKNSQIISTNDLKKYLRESLPEYMIPSVFVELNELPLTPNGKIDKNLLPVPKNTKADDENFIAPRFPVEETLANIWKEVLGLEKISVHDNFFELGGDSITSIQIISRANQSGIKLTPKKIFQFQTIAELSNVIDFAEPASFVQGSVIGKVPITPIQHWFFEQELPELNHYNHSILLKVPKNLNEKFLEETNSELLKHHDALRLRFEKTNSDWEQINSGIDNHTNVFSVEDLSGIAANDLNDKLEKSINEVQTSLSLSTGPLFRVRLYKTDSSNEDRLLIIIHHLCVDGISWRILLEDFYNKYKQLSNEEKIQLPSKTNSFKVWSNKLNDYSNSQKLLEEKDYWLSISNSNLKNIPVDFPLNKNENIIESVDRVNFELDKITTQLLLKDATKAYNTKMNDILLTSLITAYNNWSEENKLLINLEGHGREELFDEADLSRTVGWFTSMFPVVLELVNKNDNGESLKSVKERLRQIPNNGIGFGLLKYSCDNESIKEKFRLLPEPQIIFNYLGQMNENIASGSDWRLGNKSIMLSQNKKGLRKHLIEINSIIIENKLKMDFNFSKNIHKKETIQTFAKMYEEALKNIIEHCMTSDAGGYTPSDFSAAGLNQQELDNLLANLN